MNFVHFAISQHVLRRLDGVVGRLGVELLAVGRLLLGLLDALLVVRLVGLLLGLAVEYYLVHVDLLVRSGHVVPLIRLVEQGSLDEHLEVLVGVGLLGVKLAFIFVFVLHQLELLEGHVDRAAHGRIDDEDDLFAVIRRLVFGSLLPLDLVSFGILTVKDALLGLLFELLLPLLSLARLLLLLLLFVHLDEIIFGHIAKLFVRLIVFEILSHLLDFAQVGVQVFAYLLLSLEDRILLGELFPQFLFLLLQLKLLLFLGIYVLLNLLLILLRWHDSL